MHCIIGASDVVSTSTGRILSAMTSFGLVRISYSIRRLSSLATFVVPTPVKTILELFKPAFGVLLKAGDAEPVDRGKTDWLVGHNVTVVCR